MNTMTDYDRETDTYGTPEGFRLAKPLVLPNVSSFDELFTVDRVWDFSTMSHHKGYPQAETPATIKREGFEREVGRFMAFRHLPTPNLCVTPTGMVLDEIFGDDFAFFDRVGWEGIYHEANDRVLIVASASGIIASRYLAYIDPTTLPTFGE